MSPASRRLNVLSALLAACAAGPTRSKTAEGTATAIDSGEAVVAAPRETPECSAGRAAIAADAARSSERPCSADAECSTMINPGGHVGVRLLVHGADRDALEARAHAHLERCGAFYYDGPLLSHDVYTTVEAHCVSLRCEAKETIVHVEY